MISIDILTVSGAIFLLGGKGVELGNYSKGKGKIKNLMSNTSRKSQVSEVYEINPKDAM